MAKRLTGNLPEDKFDPNIAQSANVAGTFSLEEIVDASAVEYSDQWQSTCVNCGEGDLPQQDFVDGDVVNPFQFGILGNWRPKRSYKFLTDREYTANTRDDGYYEDAGGLVTANDMRFLWEDPASAAQRSEWTFAEQVTKYSPYGYEVENQDAVGRYSAAVYGYNNSLVTAVGANMRYQEMAYDGFEDYVAFLACDDNHFRLDAAQQTGLSMLYAHSGRYSYQVPNGQALVYNKPVIDEQACAEALSGGKKPRSLDGLGNTQDGTDYVLSNCDCLGKFAPSSSKRYVVNLWVRAETENFTYTGIEANINFTGSPVTFTFEPRGKVIEGWQRIYGEFEIPAGATGISVDVSNETLENVYIDDVRLHPFLGNMKSYVFNPVNLKMEAELDANNYATFYIYDAEGKLTLIKKETREGIRTIQENRGSTQRND